MNNSEQLAKLKRRFDHSYKTMSKQDKKQLGKAIIALSMKILLRAKT